MYKLGKHVQHYLPLLAIFAMGILGFVYFPYDQSFQIVLTIAMACGYITWGIVHHFIHKDLHIQVIAEYIFIAFLGVVVVFSLLL